MKRVKGFFIRRGKETLNRKINLNESLKHIFCLNKNIFNY